MQNCSRNNIWEKCLLEIIIGFIVHIDDSTNLLISTVILCFLKDTTCDNRIGKVPSQVIMPHKAIVTAKAGVRNP